MEIAQAVQDSGPVPGWWLVGFFAAGAFCVCLGLAFVRDYRGLSRRIAAAARDQDAQRIINKLVGWVFLLGGAVFVYGVATVVLERIAG